MIPGFQDVCCISACPNHIESGRSDSSTCYFPFPTNTNLLYKWMRIILDPQNSKVCSDHFLNTDIVEPEDLLDKRTDRAGQLKLKEDAVPVFILHKAMHSEETPTPSSSCSPSEGTEKSKRSPKQWSVVRKRMSKPVTVGSSVLHRKEIAEPSAEMNEDSDESACDRLTMSDAFMEVDRADREKSGSDDVQVVYEGSSSGVSEVSKGNDGVKMLAKDHMVGLNVDSSGLPWVCRTCHQGFNVSGDLTRHLCMTHNVIAFPCENCKKQFQTEQKLKTHKKFCSKDGRIAVPKGRGSSGSQLRKVDSNWANTSRTVQFASASPKTHQIHHNTKKTYEAASGGTHQAKPSNKSDFSSDKNLEVRRSDQNSANVHSNENDMSCDKSVKTDQNFSIAEKIVPVRPKKTPVFQCEKCGKQLTSKLSLVNHVHHSCPTLDSVSEMYRKHKCETCGEGFRSKEKLANHSRVHFKMFTCQTCGKRYLLKHSFMQHLQTHLMTDQQMDLAMCEKCGKTFRSEKSLKKHCVVHSEKPYTCETCGKKFRTNKLLKVHFTTHTELKGYMCETCGKIFQKNSSLRTHCMSHKTERPYACDICGMSFILRSHLVSHHRRHDGEKRYMCYFCDKAFYTRTAVKIHHMIHTGEKPWKCEMCEKQFRVRTLLNKHMRLQHVEKPHECDICGKRFATKQMLDFHLGDHSDDEASEQIAAPFTCTTCGKGFAEESNLKRHQSYHTKAAHDTPGKMTKRTASVHRHHTARGRIFECVRCGKILTTAYGLTLHERMHTSEKPFVCNTCGKAFINRKSLKCHAMMHTGEKPYKCSVCGQGFRSSQPLAHHHALHGEKPDVARHELTSAPHPDTSAAVTMPESQAVPVNESSTNM